MNTMIQKLQSNAITNNNYAAGTILALSASYLPFALSFNVARSLHLTAANYSESGNMAAIVGILAALISGFAIYHARASVKTMLILAVTVFAMFGVLISLIV